MPELTAQKGRLSCQKARRRRETLFKKISRYSAECDADVHLSIRMKKTGQIFTITTEAKDWPLSQDDLVYDQLLWPGQTSCQYELTFCKEDSIPETDSKEIAEIRHGQRQCTISSQQRIGSVKDSFAKKAFGIALTHACTDLGVFR